MTQPKKLIEVAMPIKEISAESVRDKSIRHGHISTLHLWWARRPLPVCRAVVFASLVPDPLDVNCPQSFRDAIEILLGKENNNGDPYSTYKDIPWTAAIDPMDDNLRNRLQMFIGKFTDDMQQALLHNKTNPTPGNQLSDVSLIKWENKNNEAVISKARKLIFVSHQCASLGSTKTADELLEEFDSLYGAIKQGEHELYSLQDRHIETESSMQLTENLNIAIEAFLDHMPNVFDPFAGGGAIPLEAARLGCRSYGNDINPVAHIIQKGSLEFPQKYGKPITFSKTEFIKLYGKEFWDKHPQENKVVKDGDTIGITIPNRLSFDLEFYSKKLLQLAKNEIGSLYPSNKQGDKPIAYYWARVGQCTNPSCKAEVPLLRDFYLANKDSKKIFLKPEIVSNKINFSIEKGAHNLEGWMYRANLKCPCCGNMTEVKELKKQFIAGSTKERLIAVVEEFNGEKYYRLPTKDEVDILNHLPSIVSPSELMPEKDSQNIKIPLWGFKRWADMFLPRQKVLIECLIQSQKKLFKERDVDYLNNDYHKCIYTYLSILIDRTILDSTSFGRWHSKMEKNEHPYGRQAIPMVFDFPEVNVFANGTSNMLNRLEYITKVINSESSNSFASIVINSSSGDISQFGNKTLNASITDPPYYDAIAYADLSDFFYTWLKRMLYEIYPLSFAVPQTPKSEECTAIKHRFNGDGDAANKHFEKKLMEIFIAIEHQTSDIVSIMFAHQSTEAWTTLCNSILGASMNITGSWAVDTEMGSRMLAMGNAALSSSVTVSCRPSQKNGFGNYKEVKKDIEKTVAKEVEELYALGFRGADLLTACFGQAVSEFGKYKKVERADGSEVTVAELLEMARESAFNALLKGFDGDDFTKFYIGWLQLYSFTESDFDDAAKFSRVGLSINVQELFTEHILIKHNGNKQTLGTFEERLNANKNLGDKLNSFLIDHVHRGMALFKGNNRGALLQYIAKIAAQPESSFWRVLTSICELLPSGCEDHKQAIGLLANKDSLIRESKTVQPVTYEQGNLFE